MLTNKILETVKIKKKFPQKIIIFFNQQIHRGSCFNMPECKDEQFGLTRVTGRKERGA